ncbi:MAG: hypothetical protein RLY31_519 [Bacteroidota bacterium]
MKILFATDFSDASNHAFRYCLGFAEFLSADIQVLHVYRPLNVRGHHSPNLMEDMLKDHDLDLLEEFRAGTAGLRSMISEAGLESMPVTFVLEKGDAVDIICRQAASLDAGLVVLGTKGAGFVKEIFMGSVAAEVLEQAPCPVLVVPEAAVFDGRIDTMAVTTDYTGEDAAAVRLAADWANRLQAHLHCVHVDSTHTEEISHEMDRFRKYFEGSRQITFHVLDEFDMQKALVAFAVDRQVDLLVMVAHQRNFFRELFRYSHAKSMSYHRNIPLLVFHPSDL